MTPDATEPRGDLVLRTMAMPADTNPNGDIFGGWILSQMDIAGGILATGIAGGRTVTVAVNGLKFIRPVSVGDVVCCYGELVRIGRTSMTLHLEVWGKPMLQTTERHEPRFRVTEAEFVFVAIDKDGRKRPVPRETADEKDASLLQRGE